MRWMGTVAFAAILLTAVSSYGTPIRPDIRKLVAEPAQDTIQFAPARAGWNGPETATSAEFTNPAMERLTPAASKREFRASLVALALPDWRIVAALGLIIIMLRMARRKRAEQTTPATLEASNPVQADDTLRPAA